MKTHVYSFADPPPGDAAAKKAILGGKGASLAAMTQAGLPVPPGFTISAACCRHVHVRGGAWPDGLHEQVRTHLNQLEEQTGRRFGQGPRPLLVSVRSGAAVSMPGMMDTILNCGIHAGLAPVSGETREFYGALGHFVRSYAATVKGMDLDLPSDPAGHDRAMADRLLTAYEAKTGEPFPTDPWTLLVACINAVFRSFESDRAKAYRERHGIRGLLGTAVNVQAMWPSEVSGILFTRDPNAAESDTMIIESFFGLGESVVSGDVTPDRFVVKRGDVKNVQTVLGNRRPSDSEAPSLSPSQIAELCELAGRVEEHFGAPMDIEWGRAGGRFALLQSRPIRGLDIAADVERGRREEIDRLRSLAGGKRRVWMIHNLGETLSMPTPLTWDIVKRFMSGAGGYGLMYQDFGYRPSEEVRRQGFLQLVCGRIYCDPERQAQLFWKDLPYTYDVNALLDDPALLERAPATFDLKKVDETFILKVPGMLHAMFRNARIMRRARRRAKRTFEHRALPPYLDYIRRKRRERIDRLSIKGLLAELTDRSHRVLDDFGKESLKPGFLGGLALAELERTLTRLLGKEAGARLTGDLTSGLAGDITFEQDTLLYRVAAGDATMNRFLEEFGHRAVGEMELAEPRYREDTTYLEKVLAGYRTQAGPTPEELHDANARRRREAEAGLPATLAAWGGSSFAEEVDARLREARRLLPYREIGKHYLMMGYELVRLVVLELGRRFDLGNDIFFLELNELKRCEDQRNDLTDRIAQRKVRWRSGQRLDMPDLIDSESLNQLGLPRAIDAADELAGDAVASGIATGRARIVYDPRQADDWGTDSILVCPSTDPGWTPLFLHARGLVVERGGMLSHGAIVARDFGIPAVVCPNATKRIPRGSTIRVDGNRGRITVVRE